MRPQAINGHARATWAPGGVPAPYPPAPARCPKGCDVATPPEPADRPDRYVCVGCGTEFTWKGPPS